MTHDRTRKLAASFDLLSDQRRLRALLCLRDRGEPIALSELAAEVAARESWGGDASDERVDRVAVSLAHAHVPKLCDAGVAEYDPEAKVVSPAGGADADAVDAVVEAVFEASPRPGE